MSTESVYAVTLFYCYAREDEWLLKELEKHLAPLKLKRQGYLNGWYDRQIEAGMEWEQEIERHLSAANLILILLSPDFMHSDACDEEMHRALELHHSGRARVIPLLLRPILYAQFSGKALRWPLSNAYTTMVNPSRPSPTRTRCFARSHIILATLSGSNSTFRLSRYAKTILFCTSCIFTAVNDSKWPPDIPLDKRGGGKQF